MKYVNKFDTDNADETCPKGEKVAWAVTNGLDKIMAVTVCEGGSFRLYDEGGSIMSMPRPKFDKERAREKEIARKEKLLEKIREKVLEVLKYEHSDGPFELVTDEGPMWIRDTSNKMQGPAMLKAVDTLNVCMEIKKLIESEDMESGDDSK